MTCVRCGAEPAHARGLGGSCYMRARRRGLLDLWGLPPERRPGPGRKVTCLDVLDNARWLVEQGGYSWDRPRLIAERLGMTYGAYMRALLRAKARERETPAA